MSFYDADDFEEEFMDDDEEANAFEITVSAVFEGHGEDAQAGLASARVAAEESIYDGNWELDEGKLIGEPDTAGRMQFEFTGIAVIEADSVEEAIDIAATELSDEWDLVGDPKPVYLDD
ncbi:MAG: hypothetical protein ABI947_24270 [Chloroflexota bacterium]